MWRYVAFGVLKRKGKKNPKRQRYWSKQTLDMQWAEQLIREIKSWKTSKRREEKEK